MTIFSRQGNTNTGNYVELNDIQGIKLVGDCTVWEDLRFLATAINPQGATNPATFDTTHIGFSFAAGATNVISVIAQMPHAWKEGTNIHPNLHWHPVNTNTGNVYWRMEYEWHNVGEAYTNTYTTVNILDAGNGVTKEHQLIDFGAIDGTGKTLSSILKIKISRIGAENGLGGFCENRTAASDDAVASLRLKGWGLMV